MRKRENSREKAIAQEKEYTKKGCERQGRERGGGKRDSTLVETKLYKNMQRKPEANAMINTKYL